MFVQSNTNDGFSAGNNLGINSQLAEYYLLLNSDTLIRSGAIKKLVDTAKKFPKAGLISPRLEWPNEDGQESCFRFHSSQSEFMAAAQTGVIDRMLRRYIVALPVQQEIISPDWTSFACVLIKAKVFEHIGLLDEGYFMYFEAVEYCLRVSKAGWDIVHTPDARVVHLRGRSSPVKQNIQQNKRLPAYFYESRSRYFYQISGIKGLLLSNCMWCLGRLISKSRQILGRDDKNMVEKQWKDIWKNSFRPLNKYTHPSSK